MKNISVFFPCFNEAGNIEDTVRSAIKVLEMLKLDYEIIIVNDGSTDDTAKLSDALAKKNPKIRVINHPKNLGYGEALKSGFYNAKYDTIVYTDGDRQFDFSQISKFLEKIKDCDLVVGYRIKRQDPLFRILFKKGWKLSLFTFFGFTLRDVDCGFKMVRKKVLEKIPHLESTRGAMINAELAIKAKKYGFKVEEVGVNHYPRIKGKPTGASINVIIRSYLDLVKLWWKLKDEKWAFLMLLMILITASFFRFYKIDQYMTFLGDEGRDGVIVKDIIVKHNFPFIGPPTSVGNIYLGPLYYYMMTLPMSVFWLNPVAAAGMNALIGVLTVFLIYYLGKIWFGRAVGLVSSYLYAISPVTIIYSKSSWNPNPAPFFSLIALWGFYKAYQAKNFKWLIVTGLGAAAALQMHYLALILIPIFGTLWIIEVFKKKGRIKNLILGTLGGILAFLILMSPLFLFDLKHDFLNYKAVVKLFSSGEAVGINIFENIQKGINIFSFNLVGRYMAGENIYLTIGSIIVILLGFFRKTWVFLALGIYLFLGIFLLTFYKGNIYDHYLGFLNPIPYLLFGSILTFKKYKRFVMLVLGLLLVGLTIVNLQKNPLNDPPKNQLKRTQDIAKFVIEKTKGEDFNFALIAKNNYDSAYQFYLDQYGHKPKQLPFEKTDQLIVICEDQVCDPTHNPKQEVAAFGWSKIDWMIDAYGVKIFRLIVNPTGAP